jgi:pyrrolidone-carboxylate peptidase
MELQKSVGQYVSKHVREYVREHVSKSSAKARLKSGFAIHLPSAPKVKEILTLSIPVKR